MNQKMKFLVPTLLLISSIFISVPGMEVYATEENKAVANTDITTNEENAILRINKGQESLDDYKILGITSVQSYNLDIVQKEILKEKTAKGADLTKDEIKKSVDTVIEKISLIVSRINNGEGTVEDYQYIGTTDINSGNLDDVNSWIKGKLDVTELKGEINQVLKALKDINKGQATLSEFQLLELENVTENNLEIVEETVLAKRSIKNADLTRAEIKEAIDEALRRANVLTKINNGLGEKADYESLTVTGITDINLVDVNAYVKNKGYNTVGKLQAGINAIVIHINNINEGNDSINDYTSLNISGVTEINITKIRSDIKIAKETKGSYLTISEISISVRSSIEFLGAVDRINLGQGTVEDFTLVNVTGVTVENLFFINLEIKGAGLVTTTDIQVKVNSIIKLYGAYVNVNAGTASIDDYTLIGITISRTDFLEGINARLKGKGYYTAVEVRTEVDCAIRIYTAFESINSGNAAIGDYVTVGCTNITDEVLIYINAEVKGLNINTYEALRIKVDEVLSFYDIFGKIENGSVILDDFLRAKIDIVNAENIEYILPKLKGNKYYTIKDVTEAIKVIINTHDAFLRISLGVASVEDYEYVGITGVTIDNLAVVNVNIRGFIFSGKDDLQVRVNDIISIYDSIFKINNIYIKVGNGEATVDDYAYIGVVGVTDANLTYVNSKIKGNVFTNSTSIQIKVREIVKVYDIYTRINAGTATLEDYLFIGVTNVSDVNLFFINNNIKGNSYFELEEVQAKVNELVLMFNSYVKINMGNGELSDYETVGVTGVTVDNITYINANIKNNNYFVLADIQAKVNVLVKEYNAYVKINAGEALLEDYTTVGITGITIENIAYVNLYVKGNNYFVLSDLQVKVDTLVKLFDCYTRINMGTASLEDYVTLGVNGVTVENKIYVDAELKGKGFTLVSDVQARVDVVINLYDAFLRINSGTATLNDYTAFGVVGVTVNNLVYVNADVKGKGYLTITEIKTSVENNINIYNALYRINLGKGSLKDYKLVGADKVTISTLIYVNANLKGLGLNTATEVTSKVNNVIEIYELNLKVSAILNRINEGNATIADYTFIEVTGVTNENLLYINADLKGVGYYAVEDIQARVDVISKVYESIIKINLGTASQDDYDALGITGVTIENLIYVNADLKGKNLNSIPEIQDRIDVNNSVYISLGRINAGEGTLSDYTTIGCTNVVEANLGYINGQLKGCGIVIASEAVIKINACVDDYDALARINNGTATINDYLLLNINGVNDSNLDYVNLKIKNSNIFVISEIKDKAEELIRVYSHLTKINLGTATVDDYNAIGLVSVTNKHLVYINAELKGKNLIELPDIQVSINNVVKIQTAYDNIDAGTASLDDYSVLGINGVTVSNLLEINLQVKDNNYRDIDSLQLRVNNAIACVAVYDRINLGEGTLDDYDFIGIRNVVVDNITQVNLKLKGKNYRTIKDIQLVVNNVIEINLAFGRINNGLGTIDDYNLLGVTGVTVENIARVNISLKGLNYKDVDKIQLNINNVIKIDGIYDKINAGTAELGDYEFLGVTGITVDNIVDINLELKGKNYRSLGDLQIEINNIVQYTEIYNRINLGEGTLEDYQKLGIDRITIDNIVYVNLELKGKNYRTLAPLRVYVNNVIDINLAYDRINEGAGTLDDYALLGLTNVTVNNIDYINIDLKDRNIRTFTEIQARITNVIKINGIYDRINAGEGTLEDYEFLDLGQVTVDNLVNINLKLKGKNLRTIVALQGEITNIIKIQLAYDNINDGKGTADDFRVIGIEVTDDTITNIALSYDKIRKGNGELSDYDALGLSGVTIDNIVEINAQIGKDRYITKAEIQAKINNVVDITNALKRIDNGDGSLDDYALLGVKGVTINNLVYINEQLKSKHYIRIADIDVIINTVVNIHRTQAFDRIKEGNGTLDDYTLLGITGVTIKNIVQVNGNVKGKDYVTVEDIQVVINNVININVTDALDRVNKGEGTLDDYSLLGITGVTINNIVYVNAELKGKDYIIVADLKVYTENYVHVLIEGAYERINKGEGTVDDYLLVGAKGVTINNVVEINREVKEKGYVTVEKLQVVINNVVNINIEEAYERISAGTATLDDYTLLGINGVTITNIVEVNARIKGNTYKTIQNIQVSVNNAVNIIGALDRINSGNGLLDDYTLLGIPGVTINNLVYVNAEFAGKNYRDTEVIKTVCATITNVNEIYLRINLGKATVEDYASLGIDGVTVDNIIYINAALTGKRFTDVENIKITANTVVNVSSNYANINSGNATLNDYTLLGIVGVDIDNIIYVNAELKDKNYLTVPEIQVAVNNVIKIKETFGRINAGSATLSDYNRIGIEVVTLDNLIYVNGELKGKGYKTIAEIEVAVNDVIRIYDAYGRINNGEGTLDDYKVVGANGVNSGNLSYVNGEMKENPTVKPVVGDIKNNVNISKLISKKVTIADIIKVINNGKETVMLTGNVKQYVQIGRKGIKKADLPLIQKAILMNKRSFGRELTLSEILNVIDTVLGNADSKYTVDRVISEYDKAKLANGSDLNKDATNSLINEVNSNITNAFKRVVAGNSSLEDFAYLNITGVTGENLIWINAEIKESIDVSLSNEDVKGKINAIQNAVDTLLKMNSYIDKINNGTETLNKDGSKNVYEYMMVGRAGINESKLSLIRQAIIIKKESLGRVLTKSEILKVIDDTLADKDSNFKVPTILNKLNASKSEENYNADTIINNTLGAINAAFVRITNGTGTKADFELLNIAGVTEENLVWINAEISEDVDVKLTSDDINGKISNVQKSVNELLDIYNYVRVINDGNETLDRDGSKNVYEYMMAGKPGITEKQLPLIRQAILIKKSSLGREITRSEILKVIEDTLADIDSPYTVVKTANALINAKNEEGYDANAIINNVSSAMNDSFIKVTEGNGTTEDFSMLNITGVTEANLSWINAEIKEGVDVKLTSDDFNGKINNVQNAINTLVELYKDVKVINDGKETIAKTKNVNEYKAIGRDGINESNLVKIREAISIEKTTLNRELTKTEILVVIDKTI